MMPTELPERIAAKIEVDPSTGCWPWCAAVDSGGYGKIYWRGRWLGSHRVVWELLVGPIPTGLDLDHLCRVRRCANPSHLEPVTRAENLRRGERCNRTHCPQGHEYTTENTLIDNRGGRRCGECCRIRARQSRYARRSAA